VDVKHKNLLELLPNDFSGRVQKAVGVKHKKCEHGGCKLTARFNFNDRGKQRGRFCAKHKEHGMVNMTIPEPREGEGPKRVCRGCRNMQYKVNFSKKQWRKRSALSRCQGCTVDRGNFFRRAFKLLKPLLDKDSSFSFHRVFSSPTFNVTVTDWVSFGSAEEAQISHPQGDCETVREFIPGRYICTVILPFKEGNPFAFIHHEAVSSEKLMQRILLLTDYPHLEENRSGYRYWEHLPNYISFPRCEDEDEDEEQWLDEEYFYFNRCDHVKTKKKKCIFFCPTEHSRHLGTSTPVVFAEATVPGLFGVTWQRGKALAFDPDVCDPSGFRCGLVFQDSFSERNFALCLPGYVPGLEEGMLPDGVPIPPAEKARYPGAFASIHETDMRFPVGEFLMEGATFEGCARAEEERKALAADRTTELARHGHTVPMLKKALRARGLKVGGRKLALVARLAEAEVEEATGTGRTTELLWHGHTVPMLKKALRARGLKVGGRKLELAARLAEAEVEEATATGTGTDTEPAA